MTLAFAPSTSAPRPYDIWGSWAVLVFWTGLGLIYAIKVRWRGRSHYERTDRQGTVLLSKGSMEMTYWSLQGAGRWMARRHITAGMLSWMSLAAGAVAGGALALGDFGIAGLAAMASGFFDLFDGIVARATGTSSDAGEVLDAAVDRYAEFLFYGGLILYYLSYPVMEVVVLLALAGSSMVTYGSAKAEALNVTAPSGLMRRHERTALLVAGATLSGFSVPTLEIHSVGVPLGVPMVVVLCMIAVLSNVAAVRRLHGIADATRNRTA